MKVLLHSSRRSCWTPLAITLCCFCALQMPLLWSHGCSAWCWKDAAEPGFPSFAVLSAAHLTRFGSHLLPSGVFVNQDADPFLFELYRCCPGAVAALSTITVTNKRGGSSTILLCCLMIIFVFHLVRSSCGANYSCNM